MFLTRQQVHDLTGRKYAPAQKRVLKEKGIPFTPDDFGRPVVLIASVEKKHWGKAIADQPLPGPDFTAFPRLA